MTIAFCSFTALLASAQATDEEMPRMEVYGGYSYVWADSGNTGISVNLHGFNAAASFYMAGNLGLTLDVGGAYTDTDTALYTAMAGPRMAFNRDGKVTPFAHALFGGARGYVRGGGPSDWGFAMGLGGGVDWNLHRRFALRLAQAEYLHTALMPNIISLKDRQNNFRVGAGLVFRF